MITKICTICNTEYPLENFYDNGKNRTHSTCKKCFTKDIQIDQIEKKRKAVEYLGGKCKHCGNDNIIVLEFHHLNASKKEANLSTIKRWKLERVIIELNKCILLCANCHVIEHAIFYTEIGLNSNNYNK